jgi:uncharacterized protein
MYPELRAEGLMVKSITLVNTQECNLRCTYCYEQHKCGDRAMSYEMAKKIIDMLFESDMNNSPYINENNAKAITLEFIGGELLLETDLIDRTIEYFKWKAITLNHRWQLYYMINITTNGILYEDERVQRILRRNAGRVSVGITIDGNKELHDSCRLFPDGTGSYDIVEKAYKKYLSTNFNDRKSTKLTLAPANISHLYEAVQHLFSMGLNEVFSNVVFEKGWEIEHAKILYSEMKKLADWLLVDNRNDQYLCTLFDSNLGHPLDDSDNQNWCGGNGRMLAIDYEGVIYPCIRYTPFSLNEGVPPIIVGDVEHGVGILPEHKAVMEELNAITRRSQSTDECYNCPIASGCAWCSGYNYQETGTPNKRVTYICPMHKARVLANVYFWNSMSRGSFPINIPKEWALEIISEEEYAMLASLTIRGELIDEYTKDHDVIEEEPQYTYTPPNSGSCIGCGSGCAGSCATTCVGSCADGCTVTSISV